MKISVVQQKEKADHISSSPPTLTILSCLGIKGGGLSSESYHTLPSIISKDGWALSACRAQWDSGLAGLPVKTALSRCCKPPSRRQHAIHPPPPPPHKDHDSMLWSRPLSKLQINFNYSPISSSIQFTWLEDTFSHKPLLFSLSHINSSPPRLIQFYTVHADSVWDVFVFLAHCCQVSPIKHCDLKDRWKSRLLHHVESYLYLNGLCRTEFLLSSGHVYIITAIISFYW